MSASASAAAVEASTTAIPNGARWDSKISPGGGTATLVAAAASATAIPNGERHDSKSLHDGGGGKAKATTAGNGGC